MLQPVPASHLRPNPACQQLQRALRHPVRRLQRCDPALASDGDAAGPNPQLLPSEHSRGIHRVGCRGELPQRCQCAHRFWGLPGAGRLWVVRSGPRALRASGTGQSLMLKPVDRLPVMEHQGPRGKSRSQPRGSGLPSLPKEASLFPPLALLYLTLPIKHLHLPSVAMRLEHT